MNVTVGICAYNEGLNIGPLLVNVLYEQELPSGSEVLVVCSGCTDNTVEVVQQYAKKDARVKLYIEEQREGKASAVNQVLKNAKGEDILFVQADTMPHKGCFKKLIAKMHNPNVGLVCAQPQPINNSKELTSKLVRILWRLHDQVFKQLDDGGRARHASEVFCVRRDITSKIPSETVNDDAYIALTAKKKGWQIRYESESLVSICGPETINDYIKQRRRVIYGHHQIKKMTGEIPQYFTPLLFLNGNRKTNFLFSFLSEFDLPALIAFVWIEVTLNAIGRLDFARGKSYTIWSRAVSTKKGISRLVPE
jgi:poly-beta-1,6-N-acetyl-D-glucosamine synthase